MPDYEGVIIRPPSEAGSLILQYTLGCSHNQCIFCSAYKEKQFRVRSLSEMERQVRDCLPAFAGVRRIFLADGDALAAPQDNLLALLSLLRSHFPRLNRIGMYANAGSILRKSGDDLKRLREEGGLGILYLGVESGDDEALAWMRKGMTASRLAEAGRRVKEAGIKLSVTVLLGIAGTERSMEHARLTARLLTEIGPDHVGALTTMVVPGTRLHELQQAGGLTLPGPLVILAELAEMLDHTGMRGLFFANHASNYLPLRVRMPKERSHTVAALRKYVKDGDPSLLTPEHRRRL